MLDQSDNLNGCFVISGLYLLQEIFLLNGCFECSKNLILKLIGTAVTGT